MLKIMLFLALLPVTRAIADASGGDRAAAPFTATVATWLMHYVLCVLLLVFVDNASLRDSAVAALALTWFVRLYYFLKRD